MKWSDTTSYDGVMQIFEDACGLAYGSITSDSNAKKRAARYLNRAYHDISLMILGVSQDNQFDDPSYANRDFVKTFNLTSGTEYIDLSLLSNKILKIRKVEVTFDGTNWVPALPMTGEMYTETTDATTLANNFFKSKPYYQMEGTYLYLRPTPDASVSSGLKVWFSREIKEYDPSTMDSNEPGIDEPFHEYIGIRAALKYAIFKRLEVKNDLMSLDIECRQRLFDHYSDKNKDFDVFTLKSSFDHMK